MRVRVRPDFREHIHRLAPEFYPLMEKVIKDRAGSATDEAAFKEKAREAAFALIELKFEDLLVAETVCVALPAYAPIVESAVCPQCGEQVMATKLVTIEGGARLCRLCAGEAYLQVEGQGIILHPASEKGACVE